MRLLIVRLTVVAATLAIVLGVGEVRVRQATSEFTAALPEAEMDAARQRDHADHLLWLAS